MILLLDSLFWPVNAGIFLAAAWSIWHNLDQ